MNPPISPTWRRAVASAFVLASLGVVLVVTVAPAQAAITQDEFEECLLDLINEDRADVGAGDLLMAHDLVDDVRAWSEWMRNNEFRHMNASERNRYSPIRPSPGARNGLR